MTEKEFPASLPRDEEEVSMKDLILKVAEWRRYLLARWIFIVIIGLTGGILGFIYSTMSDPVYTAETIFVLEEENAGGGMLGQLGGLAGMAGIDVGGGGGLFQGDNILELYKSRSMVVKTLLSPVDHQGKPILLIDYYIKINDLRENWKDDLRLKNFDFSLPVEPVDQRLRDSILGKAVENINSSYLTVNKPDKKLSIIKVAVSSKDEFFSKVFNDQIVKNVNDFYVQTKTKKAIENLAILQHQTDSVRNVLNGAIYNTAAIADATPNLNPTRQILRAPAQRSQFNAEANKAILTQLVQNLELAKLSLRKETPLIQVVDQPVYPLQKVRLGRLKGIALGGLIFGFIAVLILIIKKIYLQILHGE